VKKGAQSRYGPGCGCGVRAPTAQHSTAQHSTAQHSTAQHSTAQHIRNCSWIRTSKFIYNQLYQDYPALPASTFPNPNSILSRKSCSDNPRATASFVVTANLFLERITTDRPWDTFRGQTGFSSFYFPPPLYNLRINNMAPSTSMFKILEDLKCIG